MRTCLKNGVYKPRNSSGQSCVIGTNSAVRLPDDKSHIWMPLPLDPILKHVTAIHKADKFSYSLKGPIENSQKIKQLNGLYQPVKFDIKNVRRIKYIPMKYQKLIIPKNKIKLRCPSLSTESNTGPSNILNVKRTINIKKMFSDSQKKRFQSNFINEMVKKRNTLDQTKFENISKVSILLLYIHFLFCYYLSFSKMNQFNDLLEICSTKDSTN